MTQTKNGCSPPWSRPVADQRAGCLVLAGLLVSMFIASHESLAKLNQNTADNLCVETTRKLSSLIGTPTTSVFGEPRQALQE